MIKSIFLVLVAIFTVSCSPEVFSKEEKEIKINSLVPLDDTISYNFTDLVYFKNRWYLIFRESDCHAYGRDGVVNLYTRLDNENWKLIKTFQVNGFDLRDPKFSLNGDKLTLYIHGSKYLNNELLGFSDYRSNCIGGTKWGNLEKVTLDNLKSRPYKIPGNESWPWRITWYQGKAYTFGYTFTVNSSIFDLYKSDDGLAFKGSNVMGDDFPYRGEATMRVDEKGNFYAIIRSKNLMLARSLDGNKSWKVFDEIPILSLGGPNFLFYKNKMLITGRDSRAMKVVLYSYDLDTKVYTQLFTFPSGGDCGYAGMVIKGGDLWVSYYSSHERKNREHSNVYVENISLSILGL
jgi:hypothetical protein